ncbi:MAG: translation initiation factor IF-3, partial [Clostridium saudiense]|nr:translation initiation factor IF-3 [Clostridium saudiense]
MNVISKNFTCNESIREKEIRVIDSEGNQLGVISTKEALQMAEEKDLDLVMISPTAVPPVCK